MELEEDGFERERERRQPATWNRLHNLVGRTFKPDRCCERDAIDSDANVSPLGWGRKGRLGVAKYKGSRREADVVFVK